MSIFQTVKTRCPMCDAEVGFELVHSVNADRRPDLRAAILDRSFQRQACPGCGHSFRMAPEFSYLDVGRKQFIAVYPGDKLPQWVDYERRAQASFAKAYGPGSGAEKLGAQMRARCVFGWGALNEKLLAAEAGIDDRTLELAKIAVLRSLDTMTLGAGREFRCVGTTASEFVVGWLRTSTEELDGELAIARSLLADVEADAKAWAELRGQVVGPMFVDYQRALMTPVAA
jgi:hypothetical protein